MRCDVIIGEGGSRTFVCGRNSGKQLCPFCSADGLKRQASALCDWPVDQIIAIPWRELSVGDIWVTSQKGTHGRIVEITQGCLSDARGNSIPDPTDMRCATLWVKLPQHPKPFPYFRQLNQLVTTVRGKGTCDKPCCFRHRRHAGPNRDYCKDHWNSWAEVS